MRDADAPRVRAESLTVQAQVRESAPVREPALTKEERILKSALAKIAAGVGLMSYAEVSAWSSFSVRWIRDGVQHGRFPKPDVVIAKPKSGKPTGKKPKPPSVRWRVETILAAKVFN